MSNFTNGPWTLTRASVIGSFDVLFGTRDHNEGCAIIVPSVKHWSFALGNARIVAAAPSLFTALRNLVAATQHADNRSDMGVDITDAVYLEACAALEHAEGVDDGIDEGDGER